MLLPSNQRTRLHTHKRCYVDTTLNSPLSFSHTPPKWHFFEDECVHIHKHPPWANERPSNVFPTRVEKFKSPNQLSRLKRKNFLDDQPHHNVKDEISPTCSERGCIWAVWIMSSRLASSCSLRASMLLLLSAALDPGRVTLFTSASSSSGLLSLPPK